jgi:tetratricopeptide (TPR) repeat protein
MDGLKLLLKAHDEFQERVQRGDVLGASKMLIALRKALPDDIPAELKAGFYLDEVQVLVLQNDLPAARGAVSKALAVSPDEHTRGAALVQLATIDMREEPGPETKQQLQEGLKIALKYDDHGLAGDAASNIATLLAIEGNTDEAKRYWLTAKSHYEHSGRESQVLVCEHFLARACREIRGADRAVRPSHTAGAAKFPISPVG